MSDESQETSCALDNTIKQLQEKRDNVQKANYIKWINSILTPEGMTVNNLENDFRDGLKLFQLIEKLSGEHLGKPNKGNQRFHHIDNINRCLKSLKAKKVPLEGISATSIVEGNEKSTLALIGAIMNQHEMRGSLGATKSKDINNEGDDDEKHKASLLRWCQTNVSRYGIKLRDFSTSWHNGLAFNALIHSHRPDLIDYQGLDPKNSTANLLNAFNIAEKHFNVAKLFTEKELAQGALDDHSILVYVARLYQVFHQNPPIEEKETVKSNNDKAGTLSEIEDLRKSSIRKKATAAFQELQKPQPMIDSAILRRHPSYKTKREDITKNKDITDSHDSLPITAESINAGTWECHECTYVNPSTSTVCSICFNSPVERRHLQTEVLDGHSEKLTNREQTDAPNKEKEDDVNIRDQENNSEKDPIGPSTDSHNQQLDALPDDDDDDNGLETKKEENRLSIEAILRGDSVDSLFFNKQPRPKSFDGPTWSCPGCHHINPDTTKVCELCFRTLRQLKSLPFDSTELGKMGTRFHSKEDGDDDLITRNPSSPIQMNGTTAIEQSPSDTPDHSL